MSDLDLADGEPKMNAQELISVIENMSPSERAAFGKALAKCGVIVVMKHTYAGHDRPKLGSAIQEMPNQKIPQGGSSAAKPIVSLPKGTAFMPRDPTARTEIPCGDMIGYNMPPTESKIVRNDSTGLVVQRTIIKGQAYDIPVHDRVSVPPVLSVKDFDALKKGNPVEE